MMTNSRTFLLTIFVFIGCLVVGFTVARQRSLWNDEYYSQVNSISKITFNDQWLGHIGEGGNAPLFYSLQKLLLQVLHYQTPSAWINGHWYTDARSQIILRINPVVFMSLSVSLVFYYFCSAYSWWAGLYSLLIYCSSFMLWAYWAEARPYALWVFLTTAQSILLLRLMNLQHQDQKSFLWVSLAGVNILLILTFILSLGQTLAVSILWWVFKERDWRKHIVVTVIPVLIALFYYLQQSKYKYFFGLSPEQLILTNMPLERFLILFIFMGVVGFYWWKEKRSTIEAIVSPSITKGLSYFYLMALTLSLTGVLLFLFVMRASPGQGDCIYNRYFIYLMPISVIATTALTTALVSSFSANRPARWILIAVIVGLTFMGFKNLSKQLRIDHLNNAIPDFSDMITFSTDQDGKGVRNWEPYQKYFELALPFTPQDPCVKQLLGFVDYYVGQEQKAIDLFKSTSTIHGQALFWSNYDLGVIFYKKKMWPQAKEYLLKTINSNPKLTIVLINDSIVYHQVLANANFKSSLIDDINGARHQAMILLLESLNSLKEYDAMIAMANMGLADDSISNKGAFYHYAGVAFLGKGQLDKAFLLFQKSLDLEKDNPEGYLYLAEIYKQIGQDQQAQVYLQISKQLYMKNDPRFPYGNNVNPQVF